MPESARDPIGRVARDRRRQAEPCRRSSPYSIVRTVFVGGVERTEHDLRLERLASDRLGRDAVFRGASFPEGRRTRRQQAKMGDGDQVRLIEIVHIAARRGRQPDRGQATNHEANRDFLPGHGRPCARK